jgi:Flp pilus assembly protein TadD
MVTRIYTPIAPPLTKPFPKKGAADDDAPKQEAGGFQPEPQSKSFAGGLASVQEQGRVQKIQLNTILKDFKNTMNAIGTTEEVKQEVETYLKTISIQSQKPSPSVPYIKQSLKTAADSLDQYIGQSLGQPSRVVRDWVDALLLQDIQYKTDANQAGLNSSGQNKTGASQPESSVNTGAETTSGMSQEQASPAQNTILEEPNVSRQAPKSAQKQVQASIVEDVQTASEPEKPSDKQTLSDLSPDEKRQLLARIEQGKQAPDFQTRNQSYQAALAILGTGERRPDLKGKLHTLLGKSMDEAGQLEAASNHFKQAAQSFELANQPQKQAESHYALGSIMEEQGKWDQAKVHYHKAIGLDSLSSNPQGVTQGLLQLGSIALQQGSNDEALSHFKEAYKASYQASMSNPKVRTNLLPEIFEQMGVAYERLGQVQPAENAYKMMVQVSLKNNLDINASAGLERLVKLARNHGNPVLADRYQSTLEQLLQ